MISISSRMSEFVRSQNSFDSKFLWALCEMLTGLISLASSKKSISPPFSPPSFWSANRAKLMSLFMAALNLSYMTHLLTALLNLTQMSLNESCLSYDRNVVKSHSGCILDYSLRIFLRFLDLLRIFLMTSSGSLRIQVSDLHMILC